MYVYMNKIQAELETACVCSAIQQDWIDMSYEGEGTEDTKTQLNKAKQ